MRKELQDYVWQKCCLPKEFKEEVKKMWQSADKEQQLPHDAFLRGEYSILVSLFGIHNLTSDAEGEEMLTASRKRVQEEYAIISKELSHRDTDAEDYIAWNYAKMTFEELFGSKCLPDEELKPAEPEFKVGDKVRILSLHGSPTPDEGVVDVIAHINIGNREHMYYLENHYHCAFGFSESDLEPYTEPTANKIGNPDFSNASKSVPLESDSADHVGKSNETVDRYHNRLRIAAMAMQGLLSNPSWTVTKVCRAKEVAGDDSDKATAILIKDIAEDALGFADALIEQCEKGGSK